VTLALLVTALLGAAAASSAAARGNTLTADQAKARALAADVATLDGRIDAAVQRFARATGALQAVRRQIGDNSRLQRLARLELDVARATLLSRAVSLYKHDDVSTLDALLSADDFAELVDQMAMARHVARGDQDVLRTIAQTKRQLVDTAVALAADERTAEKLVAARSAELAGIRARLGERRALLADVRADIRRAATRQAAAKPAPGPTVDPETASAGQGEWWPLIRSAAAAQGVSARGMYRLMMIESGGSATVVSAAGFVGLFQYAPSTWKGSWNTYRSASITDGAAQIQATALAIHLGHGPAWWGPSFAWAFQGR